MLQIGTATLERQDVYIDIVVRLINLAMWTIIYHSPSDEVLVGRKLVPDKIPYVIAYPISATVGGCT